jgi:hypothetical protein
MRVRFVTRQIRKGMVVEARRNVNYGAHVEGGERTVVVVLSGHKGRMVKVRTTMGHGISLVRWDGWTHDAYVVRGDIRWS